MKLYARDYRKLTKKEKADWHKLQNLEIVRVIGDRQIRRSRFRQYPTAARHFLSLFPNNFLDAVELKNARHLNVALKRFRALLNSARPTERRVLSMIRKERAYFIIASILKTYFTFGHHEAYLFPEFPLGTSHKVDYLLVGKSSGGYEFVFVELEAPAKNSTIGNGDLGKAFRSGQNQADDWRAWLDGNYPTLSEVFGKVKTADKELPHEFMRFDATRAHFVVVAGRRGDFEEKTYRIRRRGHQSGGTLILHYDNLLDAAEAVIGEQTY